MKSALVIFFIIGLISINSVVFAEELTLTKGVNLISAPLTQQQIEDAGCKLLPFRKKGTTELYSATDKLIYYDPIQKTFKPTNTMQMGTGYYIATEANCKVLFQLDPKSIVIKPGVNIIGSTYEVKLPSIEQTCGYKIGWLRSKSGYIYPQKLVYFDANSKTFSSTDVMKPYIGYYIYNAGTEDCVIAQAAAPFGFEYRINIEPSSAIMTPDQEITPVVTVGLISGSPQIVTLSAGGPAGVEIKFERPEGNAPFPSVMTIKTSSTIKPGVYTINVLASWLGKVIKQTEFTLTVISKEAYPQPVGKKVFLTSKTYSANFDSLEVADKICSDLSKSASLSGIYKAWLSDSTSSVKDRFTHPIERYILKDGTLIANNWDDLVDGTIANPIDKDESGNQVYTTDVMSGYKVWTGTLEDGSADKERNCNNWKAVENDYMSRVGLFNAKDSMWTGSPATVGCSILYPARLYCFEQ